MDNSNLLLKKVKMNCPNCGQAVIGYCARDDTLRIECDRCKSKIFSKRKNKRTLNIQLVEPANTGYQSSNGYFTI